MASSTHFFTGKIDALANLQKIPLRTNNACACTNEEYESTKPLAHTNLGLEPIGITINLSFNINIVTSIILLFQ